MATFQYGLAGVGSDVQYGKGGGRVQWSTDHFELLNSAGTQINIRTADPTAAQDVATKAYVDAAIQGLNVKAAVKAATVGNLTGTYANGTNGAGATLTVASTATIDGVSLSTGDRVLVKGQTEQTENGLYVVTSGTVLTRSTDADNTPSNEVSRGLFVFVSGGTANSATGWVLIGDPSIAGAPNLFDLGQDPMQFVQFSGGGTYSANNGVSLVGSVFSLNIAGLTNQATVGTDEIVFSNGGTNHRRSLTELKTDLGLNVGSDIQAYDAGLAALASKTTTGLMVQTGADTYTSVTLAVDGAGASAGLKVTNADGTAGNPSFGLDINGLAAGTTLVGTEVFAAYNGTANVKSTIADIATYVSGNLSIDNTRIVSAANAHTTVDTDAVAKTVTVNVEAAAGGSTVRVAEFVAAATANTDGDKVVFTQGSGSTAEVQIKAANTAGSGNVDIRLVPQGNGQVYIGQVGDGVIQADHGQTLSLKGGDGIGAGGAGSNLLSGGGAATGTDNNGGSVVLFGGAKTGTGTLGKVYYSTTYTGSGAYTPVSGEEVATKADLSSGYQPLDADLTAIAAFSGTGVAVRTAADTWATRSFVAPTEGFTISDPTAGNITFALANDLAAVEGLTTNGLAARTADGSWATRTVTAPASGITVTDGDGVAGNPTLALANDLAAVEGLSTNGIAIRTASDTWATKQVVAGTVAEAGLKITNGDGVASGDIKVGLDIVGMAAPTGAVAGTDVVAVYVGADSANRKVTVASLASSVAASVFTTIAGDTGTAQVDAVTDTLTIAGGVGVTTAATNVADADELTINMDIAKLTAEAGTFANTGVFAFFDGTDTKKVAVSKVLTDLNVVKATADGILVRTAADTYASRTLTADTGAKAGVSISNGNGQAANPTIGLDISGTTAEAGTVAGTFKVIAYNGTANTSVDLAKVLTDLEVVKAPATAGIIVKTATDTYVKRSVVNGTNGGVSVTNGDAVAGDVTLALNVADLALAGSIASTDMVAVSVGGVTKKISVQSVVSAAVAPGVHNSVVADMDNAGAFTGSVALPTGARMVEMLVKVTTPFSSGATLQLGDGTTAARWVDVNDVDLQTAGLYVVKMLDSAVGAGVSVTATVAGSPAAGAATVLGQYRSA